MLLQFDDRQKKHLAFLLDVNDKVIVEFCKISIDFIKNGINPKAFQSAAQKLQVESEVVEHCIKGLMTLFVESSKMTVSDLDFQDSVLTLGLSQDVVKEMLQIYMDSRLDIRHILTNVMIDTRHYSDLEWRLDVQVASRTLHHHIEPLVLLKLVTEEYGEKESHVLQTDPANLVHLTKVLDTALQEIKSAHCRRIARNIK